VRVLTPIRRSSPTRLAVLFFIQWMGMAAWMVPLTLVLKAHGLESIRAYAFATSAIAAFISPLFFGAVADRHVPPTRVLRWLSFATGATVALASLAIQWKWPPGWVLLIIQLHAVCLAPIVSISTAIAMSTMNEPRRQFGPVRAMGTIGWMAGCWLVSLLNADSSPVAGFASAASWLGLAVFTLFLPDIEPPKAVEHLTWHERLGLDALTLLRNRDHRVVFLATCLLNIPLAAFYPYTPLHLRDLGMEHPSGWMSLAQTTEIIGMFALGALLVRWRLKWILLAGLLFALLRYLLFILDGKLLLLIGIALHGCSYTLFYTTAQIYVNDRVEAGWRTRAQALLTLMNSGVGYLAGYLGCGLWFAACTEESGTRWPVFWGGLSAGVTAVMIYFLAAYRGRGRAPEKRTET
jgi:nucleoside transporter